MPKNRSRLLTVFLMLILIVSGVALSDMRRVQAAVTNIAVNGASAGRRFDGVGAISGGGGTSRLLWDYPPQQLNEILDFLFKPNYGASLQILKVEIGGDANSTNGAEASHQRTPTDLNYTRGYEWWLMQQAKLRNPNIKLAGLEWGAPGWFSGGFWSQDNINYIINWIKGAQSVYGLHIDYIGGWNENGYDINWYINLKSALQSNGLNTQIVGADTNWWIANDLKNNPAFNAAVDIIGPHYPCQGDGGPAISCDTGPDISTAQSLNKPIWASEQGSQHFDTGGIALARAINRGYLDSKMTAMLNWNLISSWYSNLPFGGTGLMLADQPWSGYYQVGRTIWTMAHTSQFTQPGWQYLDSGSGYLQGNRANGSYVTLKSPNNSDYSAIIETIDASAAQTATFTISGNLSTGQAHVWATNLRSSDSNTWFIHQSDVTPSGGSYTLTLQPGYLYTISTTNGQGKGATTPPTPKILTLPYTETFDGYSSGKIPKYFDTAQGAFETEQCAGGRSGMCMRQEINIAPIPWPLGSQTPPVTVIGDPHWTDYQVTTDFLLEQIGYMDLVGRLQTVYQWSTASIGYHLRVTNTGNWSLVKEDINGTDTVLKSGTVSIGLNSWHRLSLSMQGSTIQAFIDSSSVASVTDTTYLAGNAAVVVSKWQNAQFDNFSITAAGSSNHFIFDDEDPLVNYVSAIGNNWSHGGDSCCFFGTNSWNFTPNDYLTLSFTGTQISLYGLKDPAHGIGAVSVDAGLETNVDFYSATRIGNQLLWTSPILTSGVHTLKVRVTGTKNASSSGYGVDPDRFDVLLSGGAITTPTPVGSGSYDDQSSAFVFTGSGWNFGGCSPNCYNNTNSWDNTTNDFTTITFTGTQLNVYGVKDPGHGIGGVSIDGGAETNIDFYATTRTGNILMWTSPVLTNGMHTFKLRVTGTKNASSSNTWVVPDRVEVVASVSPTPTPQPTFVPPSSTPVGGISTTAWYNVINQSSGKCADATGSGTIDGTKLIQWSCGTGTNQQWQFQPTQSGYYKVIPRYSSTLVWDVTGGPAATGDSAPMQLWSYLGGANQQWQPVALGSGYYKFVAEHSGKCLEVPAWSTADGTQLTQYACNGGANQAFRLVQQP